MAAPNGPGPQAGGTGRGAKVAAGAYVVPVGDGSSQQTGRPTTSEDGESCLDGDRCLWKAYGERQFPTAQAHQLGGRGVLPGRRLVPMKDLRGRRLPTARAHKPGGTGSRVQVAVSAYGGRDGNGRSQTARAHQPGGRRVLPRRRSVPTEPVRGTEVPNGPGTPARGTGRLAPVAVTDYGGRGTAIHNGLGPPGGGRAHPTRQ